MSGTRPRAVADRFWASVDRSGGPDACWLWVRARDSRGYGRFQINRRNARASRVALALDGRPLPPGAYACHHCDVKACVNPRHLYVGTALSNRRDAIERGRVVYNPLRGEASSFARLTADAVQAIRARYALGGVGQRALARLYGVTQPTIHRVLVRETWAHV